MKLVDEQFYKTVRDFLDVYLVRQRNYSPNTQKAYKLAISQLLDYFHEEQNLLYCKIGFEQLTYTNICDYLAWLEQKRHCGLQTVNQRLMALRSFARYVSTVDPAKIHFQVELSNVPRKKEPVRIVEHLSESTLERLFSQPDTDKPNGRRDQFFMILMYDTAARCQELLDLKISDINLSKGAESILFTGKGGKTRRVPVSGSVAAHFAEYLTRFHPQNLRLNEDYVFFTTIHSTKHSMSPDTVAVFMKKYAAQCHTIYPEIPLRVHPHLLRHSRAMHLYRAGMPLVLLAEFLGHADVNTTRIYAWADTEMKRKALEQAAPEAALSVKAIWQDDEDMIKRLYGLA